MLEFCKRLFNNLCAYSVYNCMCIYIYIRTPVSVFVCVCVCVSLDPRVGSNMLLFVSLALPMPFSSDLTYVTDE